jgi:cell division protein DivIC
VKRAVASRSSQNEKVRSAKSTKPQQSAKVLKLKVPKRRQIKARNLVLVCMLAALFLWSIYPLKQRSQRERENRSLQSEINGLKAKNAALQDEVTRLKSDDYVEQLARRDLGLVKPGETSLLVVPTKEDGTSQEESQDKQKKADKDKSSSENKKEAEKKPAKSKASEKKNSETQSKSGKSWWQRTFGFLDRLTGSKSR